MVYFGGRIETKVVLSRYVQKSLKKVPRYVLLLFDRWIETINEEGIKGMREIKGYRDHALIGDRKGQRSSSLTRSWRVIYRFDEQKNVALIEVLEVNHHDY